MQKFDIPCISVSWAHSTETDILQMLATEEMFQESGGNHAFNSALVFSEHNSFTVYSNVRSSAQRQSHSFAPFRLPDSFPLRFRSHRISDDGQPVAWVKTPRGYHVRGGQVATRKPGQFLGRAGESVRDGC